MIARMQFDVPVPAAVADRVAAQLPPRVQAAVAEAASAGRLLTARCLAAVPHGARLLAAEHLAARIARANKTLAAHNPGLNVRWAGMPSFNR